MAQPQVQTSAVQMQVSGHIVDASGYNRPTVNLLTYCSATAPTGYTPDLSQLMGSLATGLSTKWANCFGTDWLCDNVSLRDLVHVTRPIYFYSMPSNFTGTIATPSGSTQESAFIEFQTLQRGKSFRGGLKLSPIPEAGVVDNHLTAGQITLYTLLLAAIANPGVYSDGTWTYDSYVWSRKYSVLDPVLDNQIAATWFTSGRVRKSTGTMRRRKPRGAY